MSVEEKLRHTFLTQAGTVRAKEGAWDEIYREVQRRELVEQSSAPGPLRGIRSGQRQVGGHARTRRVRFARVLIAAAAALVAVLAVVSQSAVSPDKAKAAGLHFVRRGGYVYATVDDPSAPAASMQAAFDQNNLNVTVSVLPSSPSVAGTLEFMDVPPSFEPIYGPKDSCLSDGALTDSGELMYTRCVIGMRVPADFSGRASIQVNGTPPAGQPYETGASAFAPGEVLHCSRVRVGMTAAEAVPILQELGVTPIWMIYGGNQEAGSVSETSVENFFIRSADAHSLRTVYVIVQSDAPLPSSFPSAYYDALSSGC
jgi:hypothetical protein